jgi:hypothetical protein
LKTALVFRGVIAGEMLGEGLHKGANVLAHTLTMEACRCSQPGLLHAKPELHRPIHIRIKSVESVQPGSGKSFDARHFIREL